MVASQFKQVHTYSYLSFYAYAQLFIEPYGYSRVLLQQLEDESDWRQQDLPSVSTLTTSGHLELL